jgi:hypothetical protein
MTLAEAVDTFRELESLHPCCLHKPFVGALMLFCRSDVDDKEFDPVKVAHVQEFLRDIAIYSPASSVAVEKLHATTLQGNKCIGYAGRTQRTVQQDTYITSTRLEHSRLRKQAGGVSNMMLLTPCYNIIVISNQQTI